MRKTQAKKLPLAPDAKYNDTLVTRFVNNLMWEGKKNTAYNIFYDAIEKVARELKATPLQVALAWLLKRSKVILPIPGTSSVAHLEENVAAAGLELPQAAYDNLSAVSHRPASLRG